MGVRRVLPSQEYGGEFSGKTQQNTVQPVPSWEDLKPKNKRRLIVTTGQDKDPSANAEQRFFHGESPDTKYIENPPPRYPR